MKAIRKKLCNVAIVDVQRDDLWPASVFSRFDEIAADFPIIVLCKDREEVASYRLKAKHTIDVISYETIDDERIICLIEAAVFRAEIYRAAAHDGRADNSVAS